MYFLKQMLAVSAIAILTTITATAEETILLMRNGELLHCELLNKSQSPRLTYEVKTDVGVSMTLDRKLVRRQLTPNEIEYEKIAPTYADTAEAQTKLADWCRDHRLISKRKEHLRRVIQLDPDNKKARQILGFKFIDGEWMTLGESKERQGLIKHKNVWVTKQELELLKTRLKSSKAQKEWFTKIKKWRHEASRGKGAKRTEALQKLQAIDDPYAVPAVMKFLKDEKLAKYKYIYIDILGEVANGPALNTIATYSLNDPDEEIRIHCFEKMRDKKSPTTVSEYVKFLKSKDNKKVNRAAYGLGYLNDKNSIGALIRALVTKHKFMEVKRRPPGQMNSTFQKNPTSGNRLGGGLSVGARPKVFTRYMKNEAVLDTLVQITGQNFSYDAKAWKHWYALQAKPKSLEARRD